MNYKDLENLEIMIPSEDQLMYSRLDIFKRVGVKSYSTDFAFLLGAGGDSYYTTDSYKHYNGITYIRTIDGDGKLDYSSWNSFHLPAVRPIIHIPEDFDVSTLPTKTINGVKVVEFGEYPQTIIKHYNNLEDDIFESYSDGKLENDNKDLYRAYDQGLFKPTGKRYTLAIRVFNDSIKPNLVHYIEREYKGKKYITVISNAATPFLARNIERGKNYIVEVSPIEWYYDEKTRTLVSRYNLFSEVEYIKKDVYDGIFRYTNLYKFLNKYFKKDIIPSKQQKDIKEDTNSIDVQKKFKEIKKQNNEKQIQDLVDQIKEEVKYYYGDKDYISIIKELYSKYLDDIDNTKVKGITLTQTDRNIVFNDFILNLTNLLTELKLISERNKKYIEMLDILDEWKDIINNNTDKEYINSVSKDLKKLSNVILPLVNGKSDANILLITIEEQRNNIMQFLVKGNVNPYKDINDLEHSFRLKFQDYLLSIIDIINKNEIVNDIANGYKEIIENKTVDVRNGYIKVLLEDIQKNIDIIKEQGNVEDKLRLKEILNNSIDFDHDIINILNQLNNRKGQIYRIVLDINDRLNDEEDIDSYKVNITI